MRLLTIAMAFVLSSSLTMAQEHWPSFRGGSAGGVAKGKGLPTKWDEKTNVAWRVEVPGRGWSSPIVWGDKVIVTSVVSEQKGREPRKGLYATDLFGKVDPGSHSWQVHCLDRRNGKMLWKREVNKGKPGGPIHIKNSYASETPVTDGKRVYAYFGNVGVFCFDLSGKPLWEKRLKPVRTRFNWGTAASPVVHKDRLYIVNDNEEESYLLALNAKTGDEIWRVARKEKSNWATPYVWENKLRTEIVTPGTGKIRSYDLNGKLLWELGGMSSISIPTPFSAQGMLYITSGYILDFRKPLYAIRPGAMGDISLKPKEKSNKYIAWCQKLAGPYHPTPIAYGDYIYVLLDRGTLSCYDAKTGKSIYQRKRIVSRSGGFTSSPWAYDGRIFCLNEDGVTYVIQAGPEFKVLGQNKLKGMGMASPAIAQGSVFLRTMEALYCIK